MNLVALAPGWLLIVLLVVLVAAAVEDGWRLQISDSFSLLVALGAGLAVLGAGASLALWQNGALMLLMLAVGTFLFAKGAMGGGDVKLLAACCLWFDWSAGWRMLVAVALVGGVEAILVTVIRALPVPPAARARAALLRRGEPLPYGIAIAAGMALFVLQAMR